MPRLDNSNHQNLDILCAIGEARWAKVESFDDNDPGAMPPMDVCADCFNAHFYGVDSGEVEHPPYSDDNYHCAVCRVKLDEWRDR